MGSSAATVTIDEGGQLRQIGVAADAAEGSMPLRQDTTSGLTKLVAVPFLLGTGIRFLRFLSKIASL